MKSRFDTGCFAKLKGSIQTLCLGPSASKINSFPEYPISRRPPG